MEFAILLSFLGESHSGLVGYHWVELTRSRKSKKRSETSSDRIVAFANESGNAIDDQKQGSNERSGECEVNQKIDFLAFYRD